MILTVIRSSTVPLSREEWKGRGLRVAVMHSGAPSPGMNPAIRAFVRLGLHNGHTMLAVCIYNPSRLRRIPWFAKIMVLRVLKRELLRKWIGWVWTVGLLWYESFNIWICRNLYYSGRSGASHQSSSTDCGKHCQHSRKHLEIQNWRIGHVRRIWWIHRRLSSSEI